MKARLTVSMEIFCNPASCMGFMDSVHVIGMVTITSGEDKMAPVHLEQASWPAGREEGN
jgi:hypothetical protein